MFACSLLLYPYSLRVSFACYLLAFLANKLFRLPLYLDVVSNSFTHSLLLTRRLRLTMRSRVCFLMADVTSLLVFLRHRIFCYVLRHGCCFVRILSGIRCFVICCLVADVYCIFSGMRCFVIILFPHGRCSVCNFSGMRYFISCLYFFSLVYKYILVCDVFVASLPMLDSTYFVTLDACLMYKWFAGGMFMLI